MRVYRVEHDVSRYQYFLPLEEEIWQTDRLRFDGTAKLPGWAPPKLVVYEPKLKRGNFFCIMGPAALICDRTAFEGLQEYLERSGEILPLPHEGEELYLVNVTCCVNALDQERTEWFVHEGVRGGITKYAFHRHLVPDTPLFKIPETCRGEILTAVGMDDPEYEFKWNVEHLGLKGLIFKEIWNDGTDSI